MVIIAGAAIYYFAFLRGQDDGMPEPISRTEPMSITKSFPQGQDKAVKEPGIKEEDILPRDQINPTVPGTQEKTADIAEPEHKPQDRVTRVPENTATVADTGSPIRKPITPPPFSPDTVKPSSEEPLPVKRGPKIPGAETLPPSSDAVTGTVPPKPDTGESEQMPLKVKAVPRYVKRVLSQDTDEEFRMILSTDGPIRKYSRFALNPPPKLVLDIPGKWKYPGDTVLPVESDTVSSIRVGEHPDMLRVVIDLKGKKTMVPEIEETQDGLVLIIKK